MQQVRQAVHDGKLGHLPSWRGTGQLGIDERLLLGAAAPGVQASPNSAEGRAQRGREGELDGQDIFANSARGMGLSAAYGVGIERRLHEQVGTHDQPNLGAPEFGTVTHYCRSYDVCAYRGSPLGCGRLVSGDGTTFSSGVYSPDDPSIAAVGYEDGRRWPCGTRLRVCAQLNTVVGENGEPDWNGEVVPQMRCIEVRRQDTCPWCSTGLLDLSESAFEALGFRLEQGVGRVTIEALD